MRPSVRVCQISLVERDPVAMTQITLDALSAYLPEPPAVGDADVVGPLAVFPLFTPPRRLTYRAFSQVAGDLAVVTELPGRASVNDLVITNATATPLLLIEGEELLGAQQNRTLDASVLVASGARVTIPVSCVERGRWQHHRHADALAPAPQSAHPSLRRLKNEQARASMNEGGVPRAEQGAVWEEVASTASRLGAAAPSEALHDVFEEHRATLAGASAAIPLHDGQTGMVAAIGGRIVVLDAVGRADVFAALHGPLVQGYALDAIQAGAGEPPAVAAVESFVASVVGAPAQKREAVGLGRDLRFANGAALVHEEELVHVSAFGGGEPRSVRIRRPSRRR